jgi:hypothetical protein
MPKTEWPLIVFPRKFGKTSVSVRQWQKIEKESRSELAENYYGMWSGVKGNSDNY